ncbi:carboxylesterase [Hyaloscypha variabilis]
MRFILSVTLVYFLVAASAQAPTAKTSNGTYQGRYLPIWDQDLFLGIPYAQPPLEQLRYKWPQSINTSFSEIQDVSSYGYSCMQYHTTFNISEDCLNLNVIRPSQNGNETVAGEGLPVLVWIFGGGLYTGSTADPQYNLSGIVKVSQDLGQPVIAVSMNYRLGMWGFLQTPALLAEGSSNAGFLDQRMALRWIQENIAAFGGDPKRVVIWGESAGAQSIAYHLFSYNGRNDGLFRAAIMESGGPTGAQVQDLSYYASPVENLTRTVGCWTAANQLACLRNLSSSALFAASPSQVWNPIIDGDFLTGYPSQLIRSGNYNAVPLLIGANTDEGTSFAISSPEPNTEQDLFNGLLTWRSYALSPPTIRQLLQLYPNNPCSEPPYAITNCTVFPSKGLQWRRGAAIAGDAVMISGRRKMCALYSQAAQPVFSYRFDTMLYGVPAIDGVQHFDNVAFSFQNISGLLGPSPEFDRERSLATAIGSAYVRFVNALDPNSVSGKGNGTQGDGGLQLPYWPRYEVEEPVNMVLNASMPYVEADTFREEGIAFLNSFEVARELLA